jgi:hypothetical protein
LRNSTVAHRADAQAFLALPVDQHLCVLGFVDQIVSLRWIRLTVNPLAATDELGRKLKLKLLIALEWPALLVSQIVERSHLSFVSNRQALSPRALEAAFETESPNASMAW